MDGFAVFYIVTTFLTTALTAMLAIYAWQHRQAPGAAAFAVMMVAIALWSLLSGLQVLSPTETIWQVWTNLKYLTVAISPVALLVFALRYTGHRSWATRRHLIAYTILPVTTQVIVWLNPWGWWKTPAGTLGLWFWIHSAYSFTLVFIGLILMSLAILRASAVRRWQAALVLLGISLPLVVNILLTFDLIPPTVDWTPVAFAATGLAFAWTLYRHRLFDLTPLAREALIDGMQDGVVVVDQHFRVVDVNPAALAMFRAVEAGTGAALLDRHLETFYPDTAALVSRLHDEAASQSVVEMACVMTQQGVPRDYSLHVTPLYDQQAALAGYLLRWHDITERKEAEAAVRQYAQELEQHNAELDAFAHTVAHDLKNPLSVLVGFSSILEARVDEITPERRDDYLHRITQTGTKMDNIIRELLLLASVRKVDEVDVAGLDMAAVFQEARDRLEAMFADAGAQVAAPDVWPTALGYAPWVEEVWVNYLSNALKYGGEPPVIAAGATLDGDVVRYWCRDNGPGLTAEEQAQLFAQFTRLHEVRAEGHGLGLSIVRRIVEKLGGQVGVESAVGAGSTFWFTLPKT